MSDNSGYLKFLESMGLDTHTYEQVCEYLSREDANLSFNQAALMVNESIKGSLGYYRNLILALEIGLKEIAELEESLKEIQNPEVK